MSKTKITPKQLYENRNTSDVFPRLIIMGLLRLLNQKLVYLQVWADSSDGIQNVTVPFFFDFSTSNNSERFIQDNYMHWTDDECTTIGMKKIDGDFKSLPYGVLSLESSSIDSGSITNRFVMGKYNKKVNGELRSYVSFLYSIPMSMSFTVNIVCENVNSMWKIEQAYREYFYKNKTFHVNYKGTVVPCRVGFPESISETKTNTYTLGQQTDKNIKLSFSLACETYYPVFDPYNERPAENVINQVSGGIILKHDIEDDDPVGEEIGTVIPQTRFDGVDIMTEQDVLIQWSFNYLVTDLLSVDILYREETDTEMTLLDTIENHNCYHLYIQEDFVEDPVLMDLIIPHDDKAVIVNTPKLKLFASPEDNIVREENVRVVDKGFILTAENQIPAILSYTVGAEDNLQEINKEVMLNIVNNMVDTEHPLSFDEFIYDKEINFKRIKLYIRDHNHPEIITPLQEEDNWIRVF